MTISLKKSILYSFITIALSILLGILLLNPLWKSIAIPGMFPSYLLPPITAPVDGVYYLQNADVGYKWDTRDPVSLWYHPLLSIILRLIPNLIASNYQFWITSICFSLCALTLIYHFTNIISVSGSLPYWLLPSCLFAPGGLVISTGNAEMPALFFATALLISVLHIQKYWLTILCAIGVILTKPNGLYMFPVLIIYCFYGFMGEETKLRNQAFIGALVVLSTWILWIWFVDLMTGGSGVYWEARRLERYYVGIGGNIFYFFGSLADAFSNGNIRDQIRYLSALVIPIVNFLVIGIVPVEKEGHRYALAAGNLAMFAISLYLGNPNKIIVYATTLPGHFSTHMLMIELIISNVSKRNKKYIVIGVAYLLYCVAAFIIFVIGTPIRWYH